jgi:hypothetical protein
MRAFFAACVIVMVISIVAVAVLVGLVQEPVSVAFATSEVRI